MQASLAIIAVLVILQGLRTFAAADSFTSFSNSYCWGMGPSCQIQLLLLVTDHELYQRSDRYGCGKYLARFGEHD